MSIPADRSPLRVEACAPTLDQYSSSETAAERMTDDLILEILPRLPAKSLCRFRCVSKHWLGLIDHPDNRKNLAQTLAGFFHTRTHTKADPDAFLQPPLLLTAVSGSPCPLKVSTSMAFLPKNSRFDVLDCCNGLLLCRLYGVSAQIAECYVVCNPATEKWVALPDSGQDTRDVVITRLGFDPAQSAHFHVFELLHDLKSRGPSRILLGVAVYSSETRGWVHKKERCNQYMRLPYADRHTQDSVFLNGHLYFHALDRGLSKCLAAVDTKGETWTNFAVPAGGRIEGFIRCSQGRLHYANFYRDEDNVVVRLAVYVLDNYESKDWTLKHIVETSHLFGGRDVTLPWGFDWVGIHPECNSIFFTAAVGQDTTFMCYNMDHRRVKVIRNLKDGIWIYLPYVPLYAEVQSLTPI